MHKTRLLAFLHCYENDVRNYKHLYIIDNNIFFICKLQMYIYFVHHIIIINNFIYLLID